MLEFSQIFTSRNPISFLPSLLQLINESQDLHSGLQIALQRVCEITGWDYAEVWTPIEEEKILECAAEWYGGAGFQEFRELSQKLRFTPDMGLPGRIWSTRQPEWLQKVFKQTNSVFSRTQMAKKVGIKTALGVPIVFNNTVLSILIFMSRKDWPKNQPMIEFISAVSAHLASMMKRFQAEETVSALEDQVEKRVQQKTEEIAKTQEPLQNEILDLKLSEQLLEKSRDVYEGLLSSIEGIVWEFDLSTSKFSFVSQQAERMLGYPIDDWFKEPTFWQDHIHGGDRETVLDFRARVVREKTDDQCEYRMITADGHARWFRDMVAVVIEEGQVVKLRGTLVEITEQKLVEEALNQERNYTAAVLDVAGALVLVLDPEGRIVRCNETCEQISGYSEIEFKSKNFCDLLGSPEQTAEIKTIFSRLLAGQFPINYESEWVSKDKSQHVIAWSNTVLLNKENVTINIIATGIDITVRKEVEQKLKEAVINLERSNQELDRSSSELKEANERLKKLDELKSQFISAASHELRTPLTSMKGYVETVLQGEAGLINEQQREFLNYVKQSTDRLHRLLNELLDISKIEAGQVKMKKNLTQLGDLLKEEIMIFKAQADGKEISFDLRADAGLKRIYCDADKIREVMDNLISNAIKYTPRGGKVRIVALNNEKGVQVDIQDTGIGIKAQDQARIFEPFQQIEKTEVENEESTGLGLALVKKIIEAHKGEVMVKSQEGKGSTFTVVLPTSGFLQEDHSAPKAVEL